MFIWFIFVYESLLIHYNYLLLWENIYHNTNVDAGISRKWRLFYAYNIAFGPLKCLTIQTVNLSYLHNIQYSKVIINPFGTLGNKIHIFCFTFKVPYVLMSRCRATWSLSLRASGVTAQHSTLVRVPSLVCLRNAWSKPQVLSRVMAANSR